MLSLMLSKASVNVQYVKHFRCHLPTGKISWLCKEHQKGDHVTVMNPESTDASLAQPMTAEDDLLLKVRILRSFTF